MKCFNIHQDIVGRCLRILHVLCKMVIGFAQTDQMFEEILQDFQSSIVLIESKAFHQNTNRSGRDTTQNISNEDWAKRWKESSTHLDNARSHVYFPLFSVIL